MLRAHPEGWPAWVGGRSEPLRELLVGGAGIAPSDGEDKRDGHATTGPSQRPAADDTGDGYNRSVSTAKRPDPERIPADLDRFLGTFFTTRGWHSEIKFDPAEDRLYLEVRLESLKLSADDRFLSLVEYFARAQDAVLRRQAGLPLQCRLYASDGRELTTMLHTRGSSYLDDDARGSGMRRRLAWLGFRRRFFVRVAPGTLLWAATLVFVVGVVGLPLGIAIGSALLALGFQAIALFLLTSRSG